LIEESEILTITAEKKENVNGKHCMQRAYCQNCGTTVVGKFLLLLPLVARRKMCVSRNFGNMLGRCVQCQNVQWVNS
jgi:hypothetical protein